MTIQKEVVRHYLQEQTIQGNYFKRKTKEHADIL